MLVDEDKIQTIEIQDLPFECRDVAYRFQLCNSRFRNSQGKCYFDNLAFQNCCFEAAPYNQAGKPVPCIGFIAEQKAIQFLMNERREKITSRKVEKQQNFVEFLETNADKCPVNKRIIESVKQVTGQKTAADQNSKANTQDKQDEKSNRKKSPKKKLEDKILDEKTKIVEAVIKNQEEIPPSFTQYLKDNNHKCPVTRIINDTKAKFGFGTWSPAKDPVVTGVAGF